MYLELISPMRWICGIGSKKKVLRLAFESRGRERERKNTDVPFAKRSFFLLIIEVKYSLHIIGVYNKACFFLYLDGKCDKRRVKECRKQRTN